MNLQDNHLAHWYILRAVQLNCDSVNHISKTTSLRRRFLRPKQSHTI